MSFFDTVKAALAVLAATVIMWFAGAQAEEIRHVEVFDFDFAVAEVILRDEDGFTWSCPFGKYDWAIGDEYLLIIDNDQIDIEEV